MTPKKLFRVRLAREVRQEAEVDVWAESREDAEREAALLPSQPGRHKGWTSGMTTGPWVVSVEEG
jgi:hypothetical protein